MSTLLALQVVTWVPQNDILAHPNLRAFLSHVGINSMYEVRAALCLQLQLPTLPGPCCACSEELLTPTQGLKIVGCARYEMTVERVQFQRSAVR